jgi:hypothetical protein
LPKGVYVVQSSALDAEHEPAYDAWYDNVHIPDVLDVPGFVSARRFRIVDGGDDAHTFLTIYEIDADDVQATVKELYRRAQSGEMNILDQVWSSRSPITRLCELIGDDTSAR